MGDEAGIRAAAKSQLERFYPQISQIDTDKARAKSLDICVIFGCDSDFAVAVKQELSIRKC
jgi:hypothetical protein